MKNGDMGYIETKYGVDLSDVRVEKKLLTLIPDYKPSRGSIRIGKLPLSLQPHTLSLYVLNGFFLSHGFYAGLLLTLPPTILTLLKDVGGGDLVHEYSHAAGMKRIDKYFCLNSGSDDKSRMNEKLRGLYETLFKTFDADIPRNKIGTIEESRSILEEELSANSKLKFVTRKIANRILGVWYTKNIKRLGILEKINPEHPYIPALESVKEKIDKSKKLDSDEKEVLKELVTEEYDSASEMGFIDWIKNSPALLPEKYFSLVKLFEENIW